MKLIETEKHSVAIWKTVKKVISVSEGYFRTMNLYFGQNGVIIKSVDDEFTGFTMCYQGCSTMTDINNLTTRSKGVC